MSFITLKNVSKTYFLGKRSQPVHALEAISFQVESGESLALLGKSGSGKSTLMNLLGGLTKPTSGSLKVANKELSQLSSRELATYRSTQVGFVFQSFQLAPAFKAWENVALPLVFQGIKKSERKHRAHGLLEQVGLSKRANHRSNQLSGGEQQRVAIARSLITKPSLLLADEPTGNLDSKNAAQIMHLLQEFHKLGTTLIVVTHDQELASTYLSNIIEIADGKIKKISSDKK